MRPIESAVPEELPEVPAGGERFGPLAGISDALPGTGPLKAISKPAGYKEGLRVTDRQRLHAQVLESVLKSAASMTPEAETQIKDRSKVWRVVFSLLLIIVLLGQIALSQLQVSSAPQIYSSGILNARTHLQAIPENSTILLVADFEPSFSGEMRLASQPVLEELMLKKAQIRILSTLPNGTALVQSMLVEAQKKHPEYSLADNTMNLGYLAGGALGLSNFALAFHIPILLY